jgi:SM-20-related protein
VLYQDEFDAQGLKVIPALGTLAIFLSEEFPHEVLPTHRDRYSIAGWYRINASSADRVDPPR